MIFLPEKMTAGIVQEQNLEKQIRKQMGCMAGFFQIFDRPQILTGKRLCSSKTLPSTPLNESSPVSLEKVGSPVLSTEQEKSPHVRSTPSPDPTKKSELRTLAPETSTPPESGTKASLPLPVFDFKEGTRSSWKFSKEAPRLSLDSRAVVDTKGSLKPREIRTNAALLSAKRSEIAADDGSDDGEKQRRSTSVIARLMGLEPMLNSEPEPVKKVELRRSASESRVSRDLFQTRFIDGVNFQLRQNQPMNSESNISGNVITGNGGKDDRAMNSNSFDPKGRIAITARAEPARGPHKGIGQRKFFYDKADFFPEPKQTVSIYGEIEKRLKQRGIDEPSKDLETLKHILEALQLKGLLHSNKQSNQENNRNFVYERTYPTEESPIVVMKPSRRLSNDCPPSYGWKPGGRRNPNFTGESVSVSPRRDRPETDRNVRSQTRGRSSISPARSESSASSPNRRRPLSVESQRRVSDFTEQRRVSPVQSPRVPPRRTGSDPGNRSPTNKKPTAEINRKVEKIFVPAEDESSSVSESSISANSQTDTERLRAEEYKGGRNLLERCDKLLQSIAEMTSEMQPSPVSVLDSSFYKEESPPSPVMKRSIDFKELTFESEDDMWSPATSVESKSDDWDFLYISDVLRATNYLSDDSEVFLLLEKQQYLKGKDTSNASMLQRKLIFDTINEILNRKRRLPPWKVVSETNLTVGQTSLQQVWSEFQKIKERDTSEDLFEVICGVLRRDLAGDAVTGWGDCPVEMSEAVLDIERLIFKDLIGETIRDLAAFSGQCSSNRVQLFRRKLVF